MLYTLCICICITRYACFWYEPKQIVCENKKINKSASTRGRLEEMSTRVIEPLLFVLPDVLSACGMSERQRLSYVCACVLISASVTTVLTHVGSKYKRKKYRYKTRKQTANNRGAVSLRWFLEGRKGKTDPNLQLVEYFLSRTPSRKVPTARSVG